METAVIILSIILYIIIAIVIGNKQYNCFVNICRLNQNEYPQIPSIFLGIIWPITIIWYIIRVVFFKDWI